MREQTGQLGYPARVSSFLASATLHSALIVVLTLMPARVGTPWRTAMSHQMPQPVHRIIYYDFRKQLPEVKPLQRIGRAPRPMGAEISRQAVIATSTKPKSHTQSIWLPLPKLELKHDLRVPDLIATIGSSAPAPPPPPAVQTRPLKTFVPPPQAARQPRLPVPLAVADIKPAPPSLAGPATPLFSKNFVPEAPPASPPGNRAGMDVAIASLHPSTESKGEIPEGDRPGQFSRAPTRGPAATGDIGGSAALTIPNLTVREDKSGSVTPRESPSAARTLLYTEIIGNIPLSTLSVPLRPSSRMIPAAVDVRFHGRNVYTLVVPITNLPEYAGDWILWFAEREPQPAVTPLIHAPVPFRKLESLGESATVGNRTVQRILIAATLTKEGKLAGVSVLTNTASPLEQTVTHDMLSWEFRPATRNGAPVDIDAVIEIPFRLPLVTPRP